MNLFNKVKTAVIRIIKKLCKSKKVDELEKIVIKTGISTGLKTVTNGSLTISQEQLDDIASGIVEGLNKLSGKLMEKAK